MLTNPDIVLFAIRAGIRLAKQIQRAYVDNLKRHELILPLPNFPAKADWTSALYFFKRAGSQYVQTNPRIAELLDKAQQRTLTKEEEDEFCILHQEMKVIEAAKNGEYFSDGISAQDVTALMTVRQWQRSTDPNPTALKRIAGTVIEIAIDYYAYIPGALNENSAHGRALKGFLLAIDDLNFAETPVEEIASKLLVAAIETISETPVLLTGDEKVQRFIESVTRGISADVENRIKQIRSNRVGDLEAEEKVRRWGELIFRSILRNAGETILSNPAKFLGVSGGAKSDMVTYIGQALMDIILTDDAELDSIFSRATIDKITKVSLSALAEHPELLGFGDHDLKSMLAQIVRDLAASTRVLDPDILPEIMCLILEKTSRNLDVIWPPDASQNLLIASSRELLELLARAKKCNMERYAFRLTKGQIVESLDIILDEVIAFISHFPPNHNDKYYGA